MFLTDTEYITSPLSFLHYRSSQLATLESLPRPHSQVDIIVKTLNLQKRKSIESYPKKSHINENPSELHLISK